MSFYRVRRSSSRHPPVSGSGGVSLPRTPRSRGGFAPPEPNLVSDVRDSEIQYRIRDDTEPVLVLGLYSYSYLYMRGSYEIETDLTCNNCSTSRAQQHVCIVFAVACSTSAAVVSIFPSTMTYFLNFRPYYNLSADITSRTSKCASVVVA